MTDNLRLWNAVEKTNPAHTKQIKLGRTITAIDPYRQIKNATEQFGPAGDGWGWSVVDTKFLPTNEVACLVRVWHGSPDRYIEQWGQNGLFMDKAEAKKDTDCMKKSVTDGLTKCLSTMGFNADIFLGKFDDNKYVQQVAADFAKDEKLEAMNKAYEENKESVDFVKEALASGNFDGAAEAMAELSEEIRMALNVAPTKGGIWTLADTKLFKSEEYAEARTRYFEGKKQ